MTMDFSDMASQDGNGSSRRRILEKIPEQDKSEGEVEDYESEEDDQEDDGWITHDVNEYIIVHAWQGQMQNTNIDNRVYELEFRYYLNDHSVWFILNGGEWTNNVDKFPKDAYKTAIKRWDESLANYIVREQKIKFVKNTENALIEELREYDVDQSRQLYYFDGRVWIYKQTLPKSTRSGLIRRVVNRLVGNKNTTQLLMDLEALGKSID